MKPAEIEKLAGEYFSDVIKEKLGWIKPKVQTKCDPEGQACSELGSDSSGRTIFLICKHHTSIHKLKLS